MRLMFLVTVFITGPMLFGGLANLLGGDVFRGVLFTLGSVVVTAIVYRKFSSPLAVRRSQIESSLERRWRSTINTTIISELEESRKSKPWTWAIDQYIQHPREWYRYRKRIAQSLSSLNFDGDGLDNAIDTIFRLGSAGTHEWTETEYERGKIVERGEDPPDDIHMYHVTKTEYKATKLSPELSDSAYLQAFLAEHEPTLFR